MTLTSAQVIELDTAIAGYNFPRAYYNFATNTPFTLPSMPILEKRIRDGLVSSDPPQVKAALANIVHWGWAQTALRDHRRTTFFNAVTPPQIQAATDLFSNHRPTLIQIYGLRLPEFRMVSFASKIRMFLNPNVSATLDRQIMKMHACNPNTVLARVTQYKSSIPITVKNSASYEAWCDRLTDIRNSYPAFHGMRVADIERGFFNLVQAGQAHAASNILHDA